MDILKIQKRLNELGASPKLVEDGISGPKTLNAVKTFQKSVGIGVDGKVGPITLSKLFPSDSTTSVTDNARLKPIKFSHDELSLRAMDIAISQKGVRELTGKNDGEAVETYLKSIGLGKGYAWCMAFVYWCYQQSSQTLSISNPLIKTGGVLRQWNEIDKKYKSQEPKIGSIFIMDFGKGQGHTGFITKVNSDGTVDTIEGNSNSLGSREGNQVGINKRKVTAFRGFINI